MEPTPLDEAQRQAVATLVRAHRVGRVPADSVRAAAFVAAAGRISRLPLLTSVAVKYDIAYDAAHDIGEALLAAHGYRTGNGPGQHEALGRFLHAVLDAPATARSHGQADHRVRFPFSRSIGVGIDLPTTA